MTNLFRCLVGASILVACCHWQSAAAGTADACSVQISANDEVAFDLKEISVSRSCGTVQLTLKNTGSMPIQVMGHNWVLLAKTDLEAFLRDAVTVGPERDYVPPNDPRMIAHTKLTAGGETATTTVDLSKLKPAVSYVFVCSYPGHGLTMRGDFNIK
jgi:azurin